MSGNTSATGGYLVPVTSTPDGPVFEDQVQAVIVGISGLAGPLVRPRWQEDPPPQPSKTTTWCALGITNTTPDDNVVITHDPTDQGRDVLHRHEIVEMLASFYGPERQVTASRARDGLHVPQNREWMLVNNMGLVSADDVKSAPELVNGQWIERSDLVFVLRRRVERSYRVLNVLSAAGTVNNGEQPTPFRTE